MSKYKTPEQRAWENLRKYKPLPWLNYQEFLLDIGFKPAGMYQLRRKDPKAPLTVGCMRWLKLETIRTYATPVTSKEVKQKAQALGLSERTVRRHFAKGHTFEGLSASKPHPKRTHREATELDLLHLSLEEARKTLSEHAKAMTDNAKAMHEAAEKCRWLSQKLVEMQGTKPETLALEPDDQIASIPEPIKPELQTPEPAPTPEIKYTKFELEEKARKQAASDKMLGGSDALIF
jgi:hypothetical protein